MSTIFWWKTFLIASALKEIVECLPDISSEDVNWIGIVKRGLTGELQS
jgi:hypothetical protein